MYACSNEFHEAVAANEPQKALFLFEDGILTNEDFDIETGINLRDYFCTKEDLGIGEALSNELEFKLMNERQLLNNFPFGEMNALLGVRIAVNDNTDGFELMYGTTEWRVDENGTLIHDGVESSVQPEFTPTSLAAFEGKLYCFGASGQALAFDVETGAQVTVSLNAFMTDKVKRFAGYTYSYRNKILTVKTINQVVGGWETYEFVPLGQFIVERPKVVDDIQINITCHDLMQKFDCDMDLNITYPITLLGLLTAVCQSEGVPLATTSFINQDLSVAEAPDEFETCTKWDVIRWIAEAAAANAKISRDGELTLVWLTTVATSFDEGGYVECRPYYYQTTAVNKLTHRDTSEGTDTDTGSGTNAYLIQDNPFLR